MAKIDPEAAPRRDGTGYPAPYAAICAERRKRKLGEAAGLTQFGVNLLRLPPGQWSSQRHWHSAEDEFVYVLEGEVVLVDDGGETRLSPGDCAGFAAGEPNGHHLQNRSAREAVLLEVGSRRDTQDATTYPDIDLELREGDPTFRRKTGEPFPR